MFNTVMLWIDIRLHCSPCMQVYICSSRAWVERGARKRVLLFVRLYHCHDIVEQERYTQTKRFRNQLPLCWRVFVFALCVYVVIDDKRRTRQRWRQRCDAIKSEGKGYGLPLELNTIIILRQHKAASDLALSLSLSLSSSAEQNLSRISHTKILLQ